MCRENIIALYIDIIFNRATLDVDMALIRSVVDIDMLLTSSALSISVTAKKRAVPRCQLTRILQQFANVCD